MDDSEKPECTNLADDVTLYIWGNLAESLRPAVEAHLNECPSCNNFVSRMKEFIAASRTNRAKAEKFPSTHPDPSLIVGLEAEKLDEKDTERVSLHLLQCGPCRDAYLRLRSLSSERFEERVLAENEAPHSSLQIQDTVMLLPERAGGKRRAIDLGKIYGKNALVGPVRVSGEERLTVTLHSYHTKELEVGVGEIVCFVKVVVTETEEHARPQFEVDFRVASPQILNERLDVSVYSAKGRELVTRTANDRGVCHLWVPGTVSPGAKLVLSLKFKAIEQQLHFRLPIKKTHDASERKEKPQTRPLLDGVEKRILQLIAKGYRNDAISEELSLSEQTVKGHLFSIQTKLGLSKASELASYALHSGLIDRE
jgi:DNA-binding CsgD family transcriptional regulator